MYLIFDTETSNLPQSNYPLNHPNNARILQLGCLLLNSELNEVGSLDVLIDVPGELIISEGAFKAHGLSVTECKAYGIDIQDVLGVFSSFWMKSIYKLGYNIKFDLNRIEDEMEIVSGSRPPLSSEDNTICLMHLMTPICRIPNLNKFAKSAYKWPKLSEAYEHCFGKPPEKSHRALDDCRSTAALFEWLIVNNHIDLSDLTKSTLAH